MIKNGSKKQKHRLPTLNAISIPDGVQDAPVREFLLDKYGIEMRGGLGDFKDKVWRVGLMGESSRRNNAVLLLGASGNALPNRGYKANVEAGIEAALGKYEP